MITMKVEGVAAIRQALLKAAAKSEQQMMQLLTEMGHDIANGAARNVLAQRKALPSVPSPLADSLMVKTRSDGVVVSANMVYAPFVELGTSRMPPAPFLGPAFDEVVREQARRFRLGGRS